MVKFRPDLMEAVLAWSVGGSFMNVIKMVDVYEVGKQRCIVASTWNMSCCTSCMPWNYAMQDMSILRIYENRSTEHGSFCIALDMSHFVYIQGSLVRAMRQISQVIQELQNAVTLMGDDTLLDKIKKANESIKRDVMFAASLYL